VTLFLCGGSNLVHRPNLEEDMHAGQCGRGVTAVWPSELQHNKPHEPSQIQIGVPPHRLTAQESCRAHFPVAVFIPLLCGCPGDWKDEVDNCGAWGRRYGVSLSCSTYNAVSLYVLELWWKPNLSTFWRHTTSTDGEYHVLVVSYEHHTVTGSRSSGIGMSTTHDFSSLSTRTLYLGRERRMSLSLLLRGRDPERVR